MRELSPARLEPPPVGGLELGAVYLLFNPPCLSLLKHLLKVQGVGCHQNERTPTVLAGSSTALSAWVTRAKLVSNIT